MTQPVIISGAGGQLGYELARSCPAKYKAVAMGRAELDISDRKSIEAAIALHKPVAIINAAAYTAVDKAEEERPQASLINEQGALNLAEACKATDTRLLHVSTDFVFNGNAHSSPIPVAAPCDPQSHYGASKLAGEQAIQRILGDSAFIIRTAWLYSAHGGNFVKTMLRLMSDRDELGVIADQVGTPTWANGLAVALWQALEKEADGIHHWSDAGVASWYDFAQAIMEEGVSLGLLPGEITLKPLTTADYPTPASRPAYSVLDKTTTWQALELSGTHWRVNLRAMMHELAESLVEPDSLALTLCITGSTTIRMTRWWCWMR